MSLTARIITNEGFRVVGFKQEMTNENNQEMSAVPLFWQGFMSSGKGAELMPLMNQAPFGVIGMSVYNSDGDSPKFDYYIGCASTKVVTAEMVDYQVPAATWAVFDCESVSEMARILPLIVTEWQVESAYRLVNSGYETGEMVAPLPDIEVYPDQKGTVEVWIAVELKNK